MSADIRAKLLETLRRGRDLSRRRVVHILALTAVLAVLLHRVWTTSTPGQAAGAPSQHSVASHALQSGPTIQGGRELGIDEIRSIVARTKGFYARDYSLNLGWNNMKYILEAAINQAGVLNRTAILPSFVYARACELPNEECAAFLPMVNRGDALNSDEWRRLPLDEQMAWKMPLEVMIDLPKLRQRRNVILVSEYLRLHGLSPQLEASTGKWLRDVYHQGKDAPSLFIIKGYEFDRDVVLVDSYPDTFHPAPPSTPLSLELSRVSQGHNLLDWVKVIPVVKGAKSDEDIERELMANGWHSLYTFHSMVHQELFKSPVYPIRQAAHHTRLRGFAQYYGRVGQDVILLSGETHLYRKPGGMRFTTEAAREDFARLVLHDLVYRHQVRELAAVLEERMRAKVGGRMFLAVHMRRGDFARLRWSLAAGIEAHLMKMKDKFVNAYRLLRNIKNRKLSTYDVPDVRLDSSILSREPPTPGDPFFVMTDERSEAGLAVLRRQHAILVQDLLQPEDSERFGWPIIYTDVLALVEQTLAAHSDYFVGQAFSSVAGGVVALRAVRGADPQTAVLI